MGDSWIAVSNLGGEEAGGEHRERALAMGVALLVIMGSIHVNTPQGRVRINARVGLHSGPGESMAVAWLGWRACNGRTLTECCSVSASLPAGDAFWRCDATAHFLG